ncbi:hypothetical protein AB0G76_28910 [Streptomyces asoensis]|uniref:hypothetical protein n=1 Tax=Streptomyces asoensis TaxID=249586 RepID=UPI0033D42D2E
MIPVREQALSVALRRFGAGLVCAPAAHAGAAVPRRIVENLGRGLVAALSGSGTFLGRRLLGTGAPHVHRPSLTTPAH